MTLLIAVGWVGIALIIASFFHVMRSRQPKSVAPRRPILIASPTDLHLTETQLRDVQEGVYAVGLGASRVALLGFEHVSERGCGSIVITVTDGALYERVVRPAIERHLAARAT